MFHVKHLNFVENSVGNPYRGNILLQNLPGVVYSPINYRRFSVVRGRRTDVEASVALGAVGEEGARAG